MLIMTMTCDQCNGTVFSVYSLARYIVHLSAMTATPPPRQKKRNSEHWKTKWTLFLISLKAHCRMYQRGMAYQPCIYKIIIQPFWLIIKNVLFNPINLIHLWGIMSRLYINGWITFLRFSFYVAKEGYWRWRICVHSVIEFRGKTTLFSYWLNFKWSICSDIIQDIFWQSSREIQKLG